MDYHGDGFGVRADSRTPTALTLLYRGQRRPEQDHFQLIREPGSHRDRLPVFFGDRIDEQLDVFRTADIDRLSLNAMELGTLFAMPKRVAKNLRQPFGRIVIAKITLSGNFIAPVSDLLGRR